MYFAPPLKGFLQARFYGEGANRALAPKSAPRISGALGAKLQKIKPLSY